jgi:hypothetical protein
MHSLTMPSLQLADNSRCQQLNSLTLQQVPACTLRVCRIKKEFEQLLAENAAKPEGERLPLTYFDIDPDMREIIEEEVRQEEEQVKAEMQHEQEKNELLLSKVKARFLDSLEVERIELHALAAVVMVTSFRTAKLDSWVEDELGAMLKEKEDTEAAAGTPAPANEAEAVAAHGSGHIAMDEKMTVRAIICMCRHQLSGVFLLFQVDRMQFQSLC